MRLGSLLLEDGGYLLLDPLPPVEGELPSRVLLDPAEMLLQENLTKNMLPVPPFDGYFRADINDTITTVNDPHLEMQTVGWMPVAMCTAPIGLIAIRPYG